MVPPFRCRPRHLLLLAAVFILAHPARAEQAGLTAGPWHFVYDLDAGTANIDFGGQPLFSQVYAEVHLPDVRTSRDYRRHRASNRLLHDAFGDGTEVVITSSQGPGAEEMEQDFRFYPKLDYFLTQVVIRCPGGASSNYMAPLATEAPLDFPGADNRALIVPFDNDMWIRYNAQPFGEPAMSYEAAAFYSAADRSGLVLGSITHDTWKTGISSTSTTHALTGLQVFGGGASKITHDVLPHGTVQGESIASPLVFAGRFSDWRDGLEAFGSANALLAPLRPWSHGVPFGWNSWGKLQRKINYQKAVEVSDFFVEHLLPQGFQDQGTVYIGLDGSWEQNLTDAQAAEFVAHCSANHQLAAAYFRPFRSFRETDDTPVEGTDGKYKYRDIYLYAHGKKESFDNGTALDPTHPGTQARLRWYVDRFKKLGFSYVKADFMTHGAVEADRHYDPKVTTGMEAYTIGLKKLSDALGPDIYLDLSIAPLFPAMYADSRRISCDTFGGIGETQYELNSLTFGWWLDRVYDFNDPDHMVLGGHSEGENRARVTSAAITGLFYSGDDLSAGGDPVAKMRVEKFLTNADIDQLAREGRSFRPVEGNCGDRASALFMRRDADAIYVAAFNFEKAPATLTIDFSRLGIDAHGPVHVKELWSGTESDASDSMLVHLDATNAAVYRFALPP
jgi:alpha-galactosidase